MNDEHQSLATQSTWSYLKAAFWYGFKAPGMGTIPANALAVFGLGIIGLGEPAVWLVGLGLETTYLLAMTFNPRFQRLVRARTSEHADRTADEKRRALLETLPAESQSRLADLDRQCHRVLEINQQNDDLVVDANRAGLDRLKWAYLKLLVARNNLAKLGARESEAELARKVAALEEDLRTSADSELLRQSKSATLGILRERLVNIRRRKESLEEVDSDLNRIEAQVQLVIENASIEGKPHTLSTDIDVASSLVSANLFGDSSMAIADLDREYGTSSVPGRMSRERS